MGSPIYADWVPEESSLIYERIQAAGGITVGKTNTPEFRAGSQTFNPVFGATRNPYDLSKTCGGSSGGVLRSPSRAGWCRSPTAATSPARCATPPLSATSSGSAPHPAVCRSGRASTRGRRSRSRARWDAPWPTWPPALGHGGPGRALPALGAPRGGRTFAPPVERSRPEPGSPGAPTAAFGRARGTRARPAVLEGLGCEIVEAFPDLSDAPGVFSTSRRRLRLNLGRLYDEQGDQLKETIRWNIEVARRQSAAEVATAMRAHAELVDRMRRFMAEVDALALPVCQVTPFDIEVEWRARSRAWRCRATSSGCAAART